MTMTPVNASRLDPRPSILAFISMLLFMSVVAPTFAADHLEIRVRLNTTFTSQTRTNEHEVTALCIFGTNDWYISGPFMENARMEYWLMGTNVFERQTITSSMYLQQAKDFISEKIGTKPPSAIPGTSYPHSGQTYTRTNPWLGAFGYGVERSVWLAFCSGSFVHTPDRQIPLPIGPEYNSQEYSDETVFFEEHSALSLPKTVDLFADDGTLAAHYEVLDSTNVLGRTLPLQFRLIQNGSPGQPIGPTTAEYILLGKVLSIKPCDGPPAPDIKSTQDQGRSPRATTP